MKFENDTFTKCSVIVQRSFQPPVLSSSPSITGLSWAQSSVANTILEVERSLLDYKVLHQYNNMEAMEAFYLIGEIESNEK